MIFAFSFITGFELGIEFCLDSHNDPFVKRGVDISLGIIRLTIIAPRDLSALFDDID